MVDAANSRSDARPRSDTRTFWTSLSTPPPEPRVDGLTAATTSLLHVFSVASALFEFVADSRSVFPPEVAVAVGSCAGALKSLHRRSLFANLALRFPKVSSKLQSEPSVAIYKEAQVHRVSPIIQKPTHPPLADAPASIGFEETAFHAVTDLLDYKFDPAHWHGAVARFVNAEVTVSTLVLTSEALLLIDEAACVFLPVRALWAALDPTDASRLWLVTPGFLTLIQMSSRASAEKWAASISKRLLRLEAPDDGAGVCATWRTNRFAYGDGVVYEGLFRNARRHGGGVLSAEKDYSCVGTWVDGVVEGVARVKSKDCTFSGEMSSSVPNGWGRCVYASGEVYEGPWKSGTPPRQRVVTPP